MKLVIALMMIGAPYVRVSATARADADVGSTTSFADRVGARLGGTLSADSSWPLTTLRLTYSPQLTYARTGGVATRPIVFHAGGLAANHQLDQLTTLTLSSAVSVGEMDVQLANRQLEAQGSLSTPLQGSTLRYYSLDARAGVDRRFSARLTVGISGSASRRSVFGGSAVFPSEQRYEGLARAAWALTAIETLDGQVTMSHVAYAGDSLVQGSLSGSVYDSGQLAVTYGRRSDTLDLSARAGAMLAHYSFANAVSWTPGTPLVPPPTGSGYRVYPLGDVRASGTLARGFEGSLVLNASGGVAPTFDLMTGTLLPRGRVALDLAAVRDALAAGIGADWQRALGDLRVGTPRDVLQGRARVAYRINQALSADAGVSLLTYPTVPGSRRDLLVTISAIGVTDMQTGGW
jgi:hypothetical protein